MSAAFLGLLAGIAIVAVTGILAALNVRKKSISSRVGSHAEHRAAETRQVLEVMSPPQQTGYAQGQTPETAKILGFSGGSQKRKLDGTDGCLLS